VELVAGDVGFGVGIPGEGDGGGTGLSGEVGWWGGWSRNGGRSEDGGEVDVGIGDVVVLVEDA